MSDTEVIYFSCFIAALVMVLWTSIKAFNLRQQLDIANDRIDNLQRKVKEIYKQRQDEKNARLLMGDQSGCNPTYPTMPGRASRPVASDLTATNPHIFGMGYPPAYVPPAPCTNDDREVLRQKCDLPPAGWDCSRAADHSGPCAASPSSSPWSGGACDSGSTSSCDSGGY
jgi:hypothetical protein